MAMTINGSTGVVYPDGTSQSSGQQACKAWVNFNGTGTVAIRASFNVTSITDNGTGDYTVNFTTALADANYSSVLGCSRDGAAVTVPGNLLTVLTSSLRFEQFTAGGAAADRVIVTAAIFR